MRPDPHKQAASRKYHNKVKARGGGAVGTTGVGESTSTPASRGGRGGGGGAGAGSNRGSRGGGRGGRGGYRGRSNGDEDEGEGGPDEDGEYAPRKNYARRKITSNADRYVEHDEEVNEEEELEQGIDRQTIAFREMLKDSDQKKTFDPAAYFRFKSEKDVETQDALEDSQQARKLLEVRLNDIEVALMTLSIKDRLCLRNSDVKALDRDIVGKVSLTTGKPIVPKLVRGQVATDILIKPSAGAGAASTATMSAQYSKAVSGSSDASKQGSIDDDLDELLDITKSYGRARPAPTPSSAAVPLSTMVKPTAANAPGTKFSLQPLSKGGAKTTTNDKTSPPARKVLPPLKKGTPSSGPAEKKDEAWLDSVLGI
ncbi:hypothetical protein EC957_004472 [Mortierella hygrophila]|uniref:Uncharacterized protein n=1 Tax=Mortierella hygrophila TaxID=979708 RepID=A0A9P6K076_9FUNG|nr:hypothetical protein EC957_004472 [Mortierella hygrophila]